MNFLRASVFNYELLDILRDSIGHPSKKLLLSKFAQRFCFQLRASRYITGFIQIWVKSYCCLHLLRASIFNFECLDILRDSFGHLSKNLFSFEFAQIFYFKFWASQYITGLNRTSSLKVIVVCNCYELLFSISSISIYYGIHSDIRVKSNCRLNLLRASVFNFERLDILQDLIGHPS